jgi:CheY-like chemotaxis protein
LGVWLKRILVVDSDEQVASILSIKLKQAGLEAETAGNSADALKIIPDFCPDLIVSEMILPKMSGIDFMKRVKMNPEMMRIPFVFLSSSRDVENKILALDMGVTAVFAKPLFINDFLKNIKEILGEYGQKSVSDQAGSAPEGNVSDISVLNLLSILYENKSSGEIEFSASSDKKGTVFCEAGCVVRAETEGGENKDGMEELFNILSWSDGTFAVNYKDVDAERNISLPQEGIVGKAAEWLERYTGILKNLPPSDTVVYLDFAKFVENLNKLPDDTDTVIRNIGETGSRICDIIDSCGGDRLNTVTCLKCLFDLSLLSVENPDEGKLSESSVGSVENAENKAEVAMMEAGQAEETPAGIPAKAGKSWKLMLLFFLLALLAAAAMFIYYRGLI